MYIEQSDLSINNPQAEIKKAKIRPMIGLAVFFAVTGLQLLLNPFLYSFDYVYNIISIAILSFGTAVLFVFSLYLTEKLILKDKFRTWKIAIRCLVFGAFFGLLYLISLFFDLQTIGSSEGLEFIAGIFIGVVYTLFFIFVIFITNLIFYKLHNRKISKGIYFLLLAIPIIFSLITIGLKVNDYYDCDFSKDADCVSGKALSVSDASLCEKNKYANPQDRNECRIKVSQNSDDPSMCRKIEDGAGRDPEDFKYQCFANIAFNTKNYSLCEELTNRFYKNRCYSSIGEKTNDINICNKVINGPRQFSDCIENIATNTNNRDLCDKVDDKNKKGCRLNFDLNASRTSRDTAICDKIRNEGWGSSQVETCISHVAAHTGNYSLCEKVTDYSNYRDVCYVGASNKLTDAGICDKIKWNYNAYQCIANIAINTDNRNLCERADDDFKELCYSDFDKKTKH